MLMNCLFWNCQWLGAPLTIHTVGNIIRRHNPKLVFLSKTKAASTLGNKLMNKWNLFGLAVDRVGRSGGLALFWQKDIQVELVSFSQNHIDAGVMENTSCTKWRFTGIYGCPDSKSKSFTWQLLRSLQSQSYLPWLVGGDFNEILDNSEKQRGAVRQPGRVAAFRETLDECGLTDLGFNGVPFTWTNRREEPNTVRCRLDRVCATNGWMNLFPNALVHHFKFAGSDHIPLFFNTLREGPTTSGSRGRPFRFEAMWTRREDCEDIIKQHWTGEQSTNPYDTIINNSDGCRAALRHWSRTVVHQPKKRIDEIHRSLSELGAAIQSAEVIHRQQELRVELERTYGDLDCYWKQRSRVQWIREGERNTSFFHNQASKRKRKIWVHKIKDADGIWREDKVEIEQVITNYFQGLFTSTNPDERVMGDVLKHIEPRITGAASHLLSLHFTADECGSLFPSRDLRQGDPLSPYIFILCTEALIAMLKTETDSGRLTGIKVAPSTPVVSILCFADDTLIFCQATEADARIIQHLLAQFERASGQVVYSEKSTMAFCPSTYDIEKRTIHTILGFKVVEAHDRYLGLPATLGRTRREVFFFLRDRCWARIQGWNSSKLSKAGKETLIKAVLQAIPSYVMSCFILPKNLLDEIQALIRRFWWGARTGRYIAWMAWSNLCKPKNEGGMGYRSLKCFNLALLAKQAWRVITKPDLLLSRILRTRYFSNGDFWNATVGNRASATWRSIIIARAHLNKGTRVRIGDGKITSIWSDMWLVGE
ncbi:hypothetical protein ABFS83_13G037900 [Erythranthe nasuta]